ncbi:MAG: hypothetical protein ACREX0_17740 [Noviherbaspirillum sp.]
MQASLGRYSKKRRENTCCKNFHILDASLFCLPSPGLAAESSSGNFVMPDRSITAMTLATDLCGTPAKNMRGRERVRPRLAAQEQALGAINFNAAAVRC